MSDTKNIEDAIRDAANGMVPPSNYAENLMKQLHPVLALAAMSGNSEFITAAVCAARSIEEIGNHTVILAQSAEIMLNYADSLQP